MTNHQLEQALETAHRYRKIPDSERPVYKMEAVAMLAEIERLRSTLSDALEEIERLKGSVHEPSDGPDRAPPPVRSWDPDVI